MHTAPRWINGDRADSKEPPRNGAHVLAANIEYNPTAVARIVNDDVAAGRNRYVSRKPQLAGTITLSSNLPNIHTRCVEHKNPMLPIKDIQIVLAIKSDTAHAVQHFRLCTVLPSD